MVKRVIVYASKTLNTSQQRHCDTNKELLTVVTAVELLKYYITGRHFTVVNDYASFTWLINFKELEGMVARWITRLRLFHFKIVHRPGKHHSHADGLPRRTSCSGKHDTCPECAPLQHKVTPEECMARVITSQDPYLEHFDDYMIQLVEDDSSLFCDPPVHVPSPGEMSISREFLWYLGGHPEKGYTSSAPSSPQDLSTVPPTNSHTAVIG